MIFSPRRMTTALRSFSGSVLAASKVSSCSIVVVELLQRGFTGHT